MRNVEIGRALAKTTSDNDEYEMAYLDNAADTFGIDGQTWYNHFQTKRFRSARKDNATFWMNLILSSREVTLVISHFLMVPLL